MKLAPHYLKRYKDIALLLMKYGQPRTASRFNLEDDNSVNGSASRDVEELPNDLDALADLRGGRVMVET